VNKVQNYSYGILRCVLHSSDSRSLRGDRVGGDEMFSPDVGPVSTDDAVSCLSRQNFSQPVARGSVVGSGAMVQAGRSQVRFPMRSLDFSVNLILPAALWPWSLPSL
jgi:hypothetical protein